MLQEGERIDNHDKVCAEYYSTLLMMGAYDNEFAFFGTAYVEEGKRKCFISDNREKTYAFIRECRTKEIYPTAVENIVRRLRVNAGEKDKVTQELKLEYASEMAKRYPKEYLEKLQSVALCPINNKGADLINQVREELEGCFDEDALQLFEGAVEYAYEGKILTYAEYEMNKAWLKQERDFLAERIRPASNFRRRVTGFAYEKNGVIKYYSNAVEARTMEKRKELLCKGQFVTPVFEKEYYFNRFGDLPKKLQEFEMHIKERMDANYLQLIRDLKSIRPEIKLDAIAALEAEAKEKWGKGAFDTLQYYKTLWHLN